LPKNYVYRVDHDTGFAPHIEKRICTLSGCKKTTAEKGATRNSWVIGIGGNGTGKPNKLIYAMKVIENLHYEEFQRRFPIAGKYLSPKHAGPSVLVSKRFYYFGDKAIDLPPDLKRILVKAQGCKCISDEDAARLEQYVIERGFKCGKHGDPNNSEELPKRSCGNKRTKRKRVCR
jgi:hypothetical protein